MWSWDMFADLLILLFSLVGFICAVIFLGIVAKYSTCRTIPIILVGNACCAGLLVTGPTILQASNMFHNRCYISQQCIINVYLLFVSCGGLLHASSLQALHRLWCIVFTVGTVQHRYLRSPSFFGLCIIIQWMLSFLPLVPVYTCIVIIPSSCICQVSLTELYGFLLVAFTIYFIPLTFLIIIYSIILRYHAKNKGTIARQNLAEAQRMRRELMMLKRIAIAVLILFSLGFPYLIFFIHAQFAPLPYPYAQRVASVFVMGSCAATMIFNIMTTENVRQQLVLLIRCRTTQQIQCITTFQHRQQQTHI